MSRFRPRNGPPQTWQARVLCELLAWQKGHRIANERVFHVAGAANSPLVADGASCRA